MRIPTFSTVLGLALVLGLCASGITLVRNLPDNDQLRQMREGERILREGRRPSRPVEDRPEEAMEHLARGESLEQTEPARAARHYQRWLPAAENAMAKNPSRYQAWYAAGWARMKTGDEAGARVAWEGAARLLRSSTDAGGLYDLACCLALLGDSEGALVELDRAVGAGWRDRAHTLSDRDFASIREDPRFQAIIEKMPRARRTTLTEG